MNGGRDLERLPLSHSVLFPFLYTGRRLVNRRKSFLFWRYEFLTIYYFSLFSLYPSDTSLRQTLYRDFDKAAKARKVFKVETVRLRACIRLIENVPL